MSDEPTVGDLYDHVLEHGPAIVRAAGQLWRVWIPNAEQAREQAQRDQAGSGGSPVTPGDADG